MVLHWAVLNGHIDAAKELVDQGGDPHGADLKKNTLVHMAVRSRSNELMTLVLDRGAPISARDHRDRTALTKIIIRAGTIEPANPCSR